MSRKRKHSDDETDHREHDNEPDELIWSDEEGTEVDGIYIPPPAKHYSSNNSNTRLLITKITNNFFKSYANNQVLGPFSKCFNAIIGPNGSGKSNVIDSMLFVFGYRATKIRCKKTSVLIHNSEKYRNVHSCTVSVHFCEIVDKPGREYEIVPGSEFVVSRTANKDNSSFYELNNRRVQFKEIAKLLRNHGIDLDHNRFLILQGEVEEIAMMKCKATSENETGMLEYLEDIIGTNRYKKPLAQLTEKIENLSVLRLEKQNRLNLIKKELEQLEEPMQEAIMFLKMENKIALCKNLIYQKNIYDLEEEIATIEEDKDKITCARDELNNKLKTIAETKTEKDKVLQQESAKYNKLVQKSDQLKEAFKAADKKDVQLQADMTQTNKNRKKFKEQLAEERKKLIQLQQIPNENIKTIEECETKENQLTVKKEQLEEEKAKLLASLRSETKDLQEQKEELETQLGHLKRTVDSTKSEYDVAKSELNIALSSEQKEKKKLEELKEAVQESKAKITERTEQVAQLKRKIPLTEKSLNQALQELQDVRNQEAQLNSEIRKKRGDLEETRSSMQMSKSRGAVIDSLMQQKREGNCPGLYGRLGDLGAIDEKYDVAVSTACGPLNNVVVDSAETAKWCIEFLKKHNIGRASFIALDKIERLRQLANTRIKTPENVHRLFDLIQVEDETVKTAFYFGLRDTLVANDLDQATRIAYGAQRFRVVTLKGDLIELTGTMSGGGAVRRGRMGRSVVTNTINPKDIEAMENNLRMVEDQLRNLMQKQNSIENQVNTLHPELNRMKLDFEKYSRELHTLKEQGPFLVEQLHKQESISSSTKADPKQVEKLTAVVNAKKVKFEKASAAAQEIQVDVDKLTDIIKEKTTNKMKAMDKSINDLAKNIDKCKAEITRLRVAITTSERNAKKCEQKIATLEQNIVDAENSLREMKSERETIEVDGQKLLKCIEEITDQVTAGEEEYAKFKEEVSALSKEENKLKLKKVDIEQTYKAINEKLGEVKTKLHQLHAKIAHLKLHDIPEEPTELKKFSLEEIKSMNMEVTELELQTNQNNVKSMKPNLNIIQEYRNGQKIYCERMEELENVTAKRNDMKNLHDKVKNRRKDEFMIGFNIIRRKLKEMYQMITLGGDADFEIVDSFDPFAEGIQFNVRPPKKSWKSISNLSGGEKTLSSLSLVFALHYYKPSPLYVMDEIDAALDFKNVSIVGNYIKERTKNAQFIIISLRSNMFELCDNLIGIYKIFNCTQTITIDPTAFDEGNDQVVPEAKEQDKDEDDSNKNAESVNMETENVVPQVNGQISVEEINRSVGMDTEDINGDDSNNDSVSSAYVPPIYTLF